MRRILIVGCSGSGKTTLAIAIAKRLAIPCIELDALHWGPGWSPRPSFAADVESHTRAPSWVTDGNYATVRELLWSRADTVIWLDLPRLVVEWQVVCRSLVRWVEREEMWNGCVEPSPLGWGDPEHPVRWAWEKHAEYRECYQARFADPAWEHLSRIRLRSRERVRQFLDGQ